MQNWAELIERDLLVVEETLRLADEDEGVDGDEGVGGEGEGVEGHHRLNVQNGDHIEGGHGHDHQQLHGLHGIYTDEGEGEGEGQREGGIDDQVQRAGDSMGILNLGGQREQDEANSTTPAAAAAPSPVADHVANANADAGADDTIDTSNKTNQKRRSWWWRWWW